METIIALDVGTTGTKAVLVDRFGKVLAETYAGYAMRVHGREAEQDPADWWKAALSCLSGVVKSAPPDARFTAIVLSGQMQDVILVGEDDVLSPAILYSDARAEAEAAEILNAIGEDRLISVTANLQDATGLLAKLLWLKHYRTGLYHKARTLLIGAHDYVTWKLTGVATADYTTATTTGLFDLQANQWAQDLITELGLRTDWLPELKPTMQPAGRLKADIAALIGLQEGLPVFHGLGDAGATTLGAGAGEPGRLYAYLGTSGWLASTHAGTCVDPRSGIFNLRHPDPARLILIGPLITAAGNFEWLCRQFGDLEAAPVQSSMSVYERVTGMASQAQVGSNNLLYLPHLCGERAPFRDANARGVFFGLSMNTTRADMYRAVLEGVAFAMRSIREVMYPGGETLELNLVGGGAKSQLWPQIFADMFACRVNVLADPANVGARGAALLAAVANGWYADFAPRDFFPVARVYEPVPQAVERYERLYPVFRSLYPALKESFSVLSEALPR